MATGPGLAAVGRSPARCPGSGAARRSEMGCPGDARVRGRGCGRRGDHGHRAASTATGCHGRGRCLALLGGPARPGVGRRRQGDVGALSRRVDGGGGADQLRPAPVAVLPPDSMRHYPWAGDAPVLDPLPRWVSADVLTTGDLTIGGQTVPGEGVRAREVQRLVLSGAGADQLAGAGVGWVVVEGGGAAAPRLALPVAFADDDLVVYRVGGDRPAARRAGHHDRRARGLAGGAVRGGGRNPRHAATCAVEACRGLRQPGQEVFAGIPFTSLRSSSARS